MHPVEIAGQIAALDAASDGRAYLGLVHGAWLDELGVTTERPVTAVREAWEVVRRLLAGDAEGFAGERFSLPPGRTLRYARTRPRVPLLIGAWRPGLAALAGEIADELKVGGSANPAMVERGARSPRLSDRRHRARCRHRRRRGWRARPCACAPRAAALPARRGAARSHGGRRPELLDRLQALVAAGRADDAAALIPDAIVDRFSFAGTPAEVAAQARDVLDAGALRVEFGPPHGIDERAGVRLLAERVAPLVLAGRVGQPAGIDVSAPSMVTFEPVMYEARSEQRKTASSPTSRGSPRRFIGTRPT